MSVVPPGVSEGTPASALEAFRAALGPEAVLSSDADLAEYRDPYGLHGGADHPASAVVVPTSTEEVQAVVRIANEHRVPLWAFSQGRNNAYGGPAPLVVWGREDRLVPAVYAEEFASRIAGARVHLVEGSGHVPQVERLEETFAAVSGFLEEP